MSRNYKFLNPEGLYFISFAVVGWLDVFTRNEYKDLFLESVRFCQKEKGLENPRCRTIASCGPGIANHRNLNQDCP